MMGPLLNSGNLHDYTTVGNEGLPVYKVAFQLREAIRLRAGATTANCLAIPQTNEQGTVIDWYSPLPGDVVPWSSATSQERAHALMTLDAMQRNLVKAAKLMSGVTQREKQVVQSLLDKAFFMPDSSCVFLVNGEPVVTFWGFQGLGSTLAMDPFAPLRPPHSTENLVSPESVIHSASPGFPQALERYRAWWWWLLLIPLLMLLIFFMRSCEWKFGQPAVPPSITGNGALGDQSGGNLNPSLTIDQAGIRTESGFSTVWRWVTQESAWPNDKTSGDSATKDGVVRPTIAPDKNDTAARKGEEEQPAERSVDPTTLPNGRLDKTSTDGAELAKKEPPDSGDRINPDGNRSRPLGKLEPLPTTGFPASSSTPLTLPDPATNAGSTKFLDGAWRAGAGIQDAKTGKPVRLEYHFEDGQGKVTVRKIDGIECIGEVGANMSGTSLQISNRGQAKCSDGTTYALPMMNCAPGSDGKASCVGKYQEGNPFPVSMRHDTK